MSHNQTNSQRLPAIAALGVTLAMGFATAAQDDTTPPTEPVPEPPVQSEADEAQAQADEAVSQAALESELASAKRFEVELDALLLPDGQLDTTQEDARIKLNSLATRCGILANSAMHDRVKLVLLGYQARALAALASVEPPGDELDRVEQLNDVAQQIAAIDLPGAVASADYWLLLADLAQQSSDNLSPAKRRAQIERSLRVFIEAHGDEPAAAEYLLDTRLSLAQLMDQRGAQRGALRQLDQIGELPADSPRLEEVKRLRESIARLGTPIAFESISTELMTWRSLDHLGKPVLIHVYADSVEPSVRMIDRISRRIVEGTLSEIAVVSLRVGDPVAGSSAPPWPTLPVQLERRGVLDQLGVTALPTLAWLDGEGRLVSIGTTTAVLDQLDTLRPDPAEEDAPDEAIEPDVESNAESNAQPDVQTGEASAPADRATAGDEADPDQANTQPRKRPNQ